MMIFADIPFPIKIPEHLLELVDILHWSLPPKLAKQWPMRFKNTVQSGVDYSRVDWQFRHWLMTVEGLVIGEGKAFDDVREAVALCAKAIEAPAAGIPINKKEASIAALHVLAADNVEPESDAAAALQVAMTAVMDALGQPAPLFAHIKRPNAKGRARIAQSHVRMADQLESLMLAANERGGDND